MTRSKKICQVLLAALTLILGPATTVQADDTATGKSPVAFSVKVTGTGRPMILIPGLSCGGDVWDGTVAHFKDHYECHVLTLAGFAGQPAISAPFLEQVRAAIAKYISDQKLDHPIIIGHSLGGFMAFWVGATIPQQVGPIIAVDGLPFLPALFNPNATVETGKPFAEQFRSSLSAQTADQFAESNRKSLVTMITDPKDVDAVNATGKKSDPKAVGEAFYELMTTDLRPQVKAIQTPVLLIGATASVPDDQRTMIETIYRQQVSTIPNHKVVFAPKAKHFIQLDEPQFFYAQVESFLKTADAPNVK
jgi:pimeloyl-ACP methyl ester carboxylesterase